MKTLLLLLAALGPLTAQPVHTEVTKPTTPEDDAKANSDRVPDVYAISGKFERVLVLRLKYQADLLAMRRKYADEYESVVQRVDGELAAA